MSEGKAPAKSQTDVVIDSIKQMLIRGELTAGSRLPIEKDLAAQLGVSRGSLREGVRALATLGVLETRQGDGTYVTSLDPHHLLEPVGFVADLQQQTHAADLLAVRRLLESESVELAASRLTEGQLGELAELLDVADGLLAAGEEADLERFIETDTEFHRRIARASGNPALSALIDMLAGRTFRARLWRAIHNQGAVHETQAEHRAILDALVLRDPSRARIRMQVHLLAVEEFSAAHEADFSRESDS